MLKGSVEEVDVDEPIGANPETRSLDLHTENGHDSFAQFPHRLNKSPSVEGGQRLELLLIRAVDTRVSLSTMLGDTAIFAERGRSSELCDSVGQQNRTGDHL